MPESNLPARPATQITATASSFEGPIPPPQILQQYNNVVPGSAERIIGMAEKQSDHRMGLENKVVTSNLVKSYLGMISGTSIAIYGLYICKEIAINGNPATAGIIAAIDLGSILWVALNNTKAQKKERAKRQETSSTPPSAKG